MLDWELSGQKANFLQLGQFIINFKWTLYELPYDRARTFMAYHMPHMAVHIWILADEDSIWRNSHETLAVSSLGTLDVQRLNAENDQSQWLQIKG